MADRIFWNYLEELPEQEAAWVEWYCRLSVWHLFNTFYVHYLKVENNRARELKCYESCEHDCTRMVVENSPYDIEAVCSNEKIVPIKLKFRDILIYSLRWESFHKAICSALQIEQSSLSKRREFGSTWYLGNYQVQINKMYYPVYITYRLATLNETISSLCQLHLETFLLMIPTDRWILTEEQKILSQNSYVMFSMESVLALQHDGSFKLLRSISECIKSFNHNCTQVVHNKTLPIEAYK